MNATRPRMRFLLPALAAAFAVAAPAPAAQFTLGAHNFTLPDGFTIEIAAPASLVPRPIEADFDEQGRLYVTDSSGSNDKVTKQLADKPHRILRLEDTDGDGVFDKSVVFADKMMFPEGALWHDGSLYVSAPPSIWKLTDTNSDGVADVRVEWFKGQSLGGCANDLHGPYLGPDGWIYWCKGGFERQTNILGNGKTFASSASHIYRARPDGTGLEPIMTGGMDNPVGLAWSPEGELFLCGTFFQHPAGGKRDGIIHVIYGGVYGKENDVLDGHPRTGELLPIMTHLGPAAPAGLARYESAVFGSDYQNNLFCAQFNLHKISRHILKESGSTYATTDSDFLVSDNPDFHPTDVFEDADGSLLVIDTGGWYKLCCPTSQLPKPDVLGAIYRIRRSGVPKIHDSRGQLISWLPYNWAVSQTPQFAAFLEDQRPYVARRAVEELARHPTESIPVLSEKLLKHTGTIGSRCNAVWALTRIDTVRAREAARLGLKDRDEKVRQTSIHSASLRRDAGATKDLQGWLREDAPTHRRVAAEALGRIGDRTSVTPLLSVFADYGPQDRAHEHSLLFALIELAAASEVSAFLVSDNVHGRRAALITLDQMPGGNLKPEQVTPLLASTNALLKQTANWIISHHPEWVGALAGFLKERMAVPNLSEAERAELQQQFTKSIREPSIQRVVASVASDLALPKDSRLTAIRVMAATGFKTTPPGWEEALLPAVSGTDLELKRQAVLAARALPARITELGTALGIIVADKATPPDIRLNALCKDRGLTILGPAFREFVISQLTETNEVSLRALAAATIAAWWQFDDGPIELTNVVKSAGPLELSKILPAFARATNEAVGFALIAALKEARAFRSLRPEQVRPNLTNFPATVRAKADELLATLNTDAVKQKARLDELSLNLKSGDVRRGQAIFNSQKAACATCHAIGYLGGNLGPDLTRIGQIRTERDLLEAVVFPSASFVRSFEPMLVVTRSGDEHSGILRRDTPDEVVLATGPNAEVRLARADIVEMRPGTVSVMPQGLDEQLTREELADLLAFLKATKW